MDRMGFGFAPEVAYLYNPTATAIAKGQCVYWQAADAAVYSMPFPEPDNSGGKKNMLANQATRSAGITEPVMGVSLTTIVPSILKGPGGVAMEALAASAWGHVCLAGKVDVRIATASDIAAGDPIVATAGGNFIEVATYGTATAVHAMALEATITSGTCAAALISAFLNPGLSGLDPTFNFATA